VHAFEKIGANITKAAKLFYKTFNGENLFNDYWLQPGIKLKIWK
jgi:hypothetical protein